MSDAARDELSFTRPLEGEGSRAFEAFLAYRDLGMGRSLEQARLALGKPSEGYARFLEELSARFRWVERCRAFDDHLEAVRHRARIRAAAREAARWEARRQQALEQAWDDAELLGAKGRAMLATPLQQARWTLKTAIDALKACHDLKAAVATAAGPRALENLPAEVLRAIADVGTQAEQGEPAPAVGETTLAAPAALDEVEEGDPAGGGQDAPQDSPRDAPGPTGADA